MSNKLIYLDYAAATPIDKRVQKIMRLYSDADFYNPSAIYSPARQVHHALEAARSQVAQCLGSKSSEIIFTAGGTEANNLAVQGIMRQYPEANIVVAAIEHDSVLAPARRYDCREAAVHIDGRIDLDDLRSKIDDKTVLVSIGYANNEIGTVQSLRDIAKVVSEARNGRTGLPLYFHSDACQAGNYLDLHVARLGVDMMSINASKLYGPKQTGALYVKSDVRLEPLIFGGGQERGLRSGTENVAGCVGLAVALELAQQMRHDEVNRLRELQKQFIDLLLETIPKAKLNGSLKHRLPNNVNVTFPDEDNERLIMQLEAAGILAAAGSACGAASEEPSHVLAAIGLSDKEARASLRFTMGRSTTPEAISQTVQVLGRLIEA